MSNHSHDELQEHEIKIQVMDEVFTKRFDDLEHLINGLNSKINRLIRYVFCSLLIPIALHFYHLL